jgi:hypothetical protein
MQLKLVINELFDVDYLHAQQLVIIQWMDSCIPKEETYQKMGNTHCFNSCKKKGIIYHLFYKVYNKQGFFICAI